jgi:hypothetical protein
LPWSAWASLARAHPCDDPTLIAATSCVLRISKACTKNWGNLKSIRIYVPPVRIKIPYGYNSYMSYGVGKGKKKCNSHVSLLVSHACFSPSWPFYLEKKWERSPGLQINIF